MSFRKIAIHPEHSPFVQKRVKQKYLQGLDYTGVLRVCGNRFTDDTKYHDTYSQDKKSEKSLSFDGIGIL